MNLLDRRLRIGRFASIDLYLHWSLLLMIGYVVLLSYPQGGFVVAMALAQLVGMFVCVTLHEYGHAMAARYFGIGTADITLLAIGGIARLRSMPRVPLQELWVAVAGPAVNVVIAAIIVTIMWIVDPKWCGYIADVLLGAFATGGSDIAAIGYQSLIALMNNIARPDAIGFLLVLLLVNVTLVLFNMIPAFPMDGGRVLRSILAMMMDYRRATFWASRIGWIAAFAMAAFALSRPVPLLVPVAISAFIVYAGQAEYRHVELIEPIRGVTAGEVMIESQACVSMDAPVQIAAQTFLSTVNRRLPVVGHQKVVVGSVTIDQVTDRIAAHGIDDAMPIGMWINREDQPPIVRQSDHLEDVLPAIDRRGGCVAVVNGQGQFIGLLDPMLVAVRRRLSDQLPKVFDRVV